MFLQIGIQLYKFFVFRKVNLQMTTLKRRPKILLTSVTSKMNLKDLKASTSNAPSEHSENQFTSKKQTKKKINRNVEKDNEIESTQVFNMMKSIYEKKELDEYDVFGESYLTIHQEVQCQDRKFN